MNNVYNLLDKALLFQAVDGNGSTSKAKNEKGKQNGMNHMT